RRSLGSKPPDESRHPERLRGARDRSGRVVGESSKGPNPPGFCRRRAGGEFQPHSPKPPYKQRGQSAFTAAKTSSAWPGTLTPLHSCTRVPLPSIRKVDRSIPLTCLPYMFFILITPNCLQSFSSSSEMSSKGNFILALKLSLDFMLSLVTPTPCAHSLSNVYYSTRY